MSCHAMSRHVMSCHLMSYYVMSRHAFHSTIQDHAPAVHARTAPATVHARTVPTAGHYLTCPPEHSLGRCPHTPLSSALLVASYTSETLRGGQEAWCCMYSFFLRTDPWVLGFPRYPGRCLSQSHAGQYAWWFATSSPNPCAPFGPTAPKCPSHSTDPS